MAPGWQVKDAIASRVDAFAGDLGEVSCKQRCWHSNNAKFTTFKGYQMNTLNLPMAPNPNVTGDTDLQAKCRCLLAFDGENLTPDQLNAAQKKCLQKADRVDILLVNPHRAATSMLRELLMKLEETGFDCLLTISKGTLADQINRYIKRFLGIRWIILHTLPALGANWRVDAANLRHQGYHILSLVHSPAL